MTAALAGLSAEARHAGRVLVSAWRVCGRGGRIGAGLLAVLLAIALGLLVLPDGIAGLPDAKLRKLLQIVTLAGSALIAVGFWIRLVTNVLQQNHPQLARTVPGQVRALRAALLCVSVSVGATAALFMLAMNGPLLGVLAAVFITLAFMATILRWPLLGFGLMALSWAAPLLEPSAATHHVLLWIKASPGLAVGLAIALSLLLQVLVVMTGGPRHVVSHRRLAALAGGMRGDFMAQAWLRKGQAPGAGNAGLQVGKGLYGRWLRQTLQRPGGSSVAARLALGLGPLTHWTGMVSGLLVASAFVLLPLLLAWVSPVAHAARNMGVSMVVIVPLMVLGSVIGWPTAMWGTRREQALLRLLPGVPQGRRLNRWLAIQLALQFLAGVLVMAAISVVCIRRFDLDFQWAPVEDFVLGCAALSPFMLLTLWRDWSVLRAPTGGVQVLFMVALLVVAGTAWAWVGDGRGHWWTLAGLSALLFAPLGVWRWRVAVRAPVAWPVGRGSSGGRAGAVS